MKMITRNTILQELRDQAWHNVLCYSANYAMTQPKAGMEAEWKEALEKAKAIDRMVGENVVQGLEKQIAYAKTSVPARELLYQAHGAINMAHNLGAISTDEYLALDHECVAEGINNPKYF